MRSRDKMTILASTQKDERNQIFVFFPEGKEGNGKIGIKDVERVVTKMIDANVGRVILVLQQPMSSYASTALKVAQTLIAEIFLEAELLVNIMDHVLVPPHELLSNDEKLQLLRKYKLKETQLPRMLTTDPIARFMGLRHGDVVRITRQSETAGRYLTYRLVV
eukprot:TRINITY_DN5430_c0_g1_i3.p2 TRINITY_DN5430_c0_g1~~TRINITY_DN5430_c0_g1_i3.p2  ORF type:complete len:163 (+),score=39.74 TRINITY_DN5430_c0_g1_i3:239-727(+)